MYEIQKNSMASYYQKMALKDGRLADDACNDRFFKIQNTIFNEMDDFYIVGPRTPWCGETKLKNGGKPNEEAYFPGSGSCHGPRSAGCL